MTQTYAARHHQDYSDAARSLVNALFYRLRLHYLAGDAATSMSMLARLRAIATAHPNALEQLHLLRITELRIMSRALANGQVLMPLDVSDLASAPIGDVARVESERGVIERATCDLAGFLRGACACGSDWDLSSDVVADIEHRVLGGRVDLIVYAGRRVIAIEFKHGMAGHAVVGQIMKYRLHFEQRIGLNLWDEVYAVVVAGGFDDVARAQLERDGVLLVQHGTGPVAGWRALNRDRWSPSLITGAAAADKQ